MHGNLSSWIHCHVRRAGNPSDAQGMHEKPQPETVGWHIWHTFFSALIPTMMKQLFYVVLVDTVLACWYSTGFVDVEGNMFRTSKHIIPLQKRLEHIWFPGCFLSNQDAGYRMIGDSLRSKEDRLLASKPVNLTFKSIRGKWPTNKQHTSSNQNRMRKDKPDQMADRMPDIMQDRMSA